jgi:hypothetical protein
VRKRNDLAKKYTSQSQPNGPMQQISPLALPRKPKPVQIDLTHGPDLSDEALDQLADVTPSDVIAATAMWDSKVPKPLKGLLDAEVKPEGGQASES